MTSRTADSDLCLKWASFYHLRGWSVLPSDPQIGHPPLRFAHLWDAPASDPADLWRRWPTPALQIMLGRRWRLLVIDLDGLEARERFPRLGRVPRTWKTHSGGGGLHLWFTLPDGHPTPLPRAVLWRGEGEHSLIERLCDRSLIVAPPSLHRKTGRRYRFLDKPHSPAGLPMPAPCPAWVLGLEPLRADRPAAPLAAPAPPIGRPRGPAPGRYRAADVLAAIPDKAAIARSWGLRITGRRAGAGCLACHAVGREDRNPSAIFKEATGQYWDPWIGTHALSLFDLGALLGVYGDWRDAVADLGATFRVRETA